MPIRRAAFLSLALFALAPIAVPAESAAPSPSALPASKADDLDRYVGAYEFEPGKVMHISRVGTELRAKPTGQPEGTLKHDKKPGHFSLREAPFEFEFIEDAVGVVIALDMIAPTGQRKHLRRLPDVAAAAPLRQIALDRGTSVNAKVFNGYARAKNADGKFKTETYVFGDGGFQDDSAMRDKSIDDLSFDQIAHSLAPSLARQNYHPPDPKKPEAIDLLLMVYWGSTAGKYHPAAANNNTIRDQMNRRNARVLGYGDAVGAALSDEHVGSIRLRVHDLVDEVEEKRYWVAIVAVDFPILRDTKKIKPLWSIRYNIASQGTNFTVALPQMTEFAANFFGRDSGGLRSPSLHISEGKVEVGEAVVVPDEPAK
jgi:hypothetical protein